MVECGFDRDGGRTLVLDCGVVEGLEGVGELGILLVQLIDDDAAAELNLADFPFTIRLENLFLLVGE